MQVTRSDQVLDVSHLAKAGENTQQPTNKRKHAEESNFPSKIRKLESTALESTNKEYLSLSDLPLDVLCQIVRHVADGHWFSKSCQSVLSLNKNFYYTVMTEVLIFDGLSEGDFVSEILVLIPLNSL